MAPLPFFPRRVQIARPRASSRECPTLRAVGVISPRSLSSFPHRKPAAGSNFWKAHRRPLLPCRAARATLARPCYKFDLRARCTLFPSLRSSSPHRCPTLRRPEASPLTVRQFRKYQMGSNAHRSCFNFWPVCGTGREERVDRFTNTFCTLDYSQGKSGPMSQNEARQHAMRIESACYLAADELFRKEPHGDGTSARQLYAAESSRMVWEVLSEKSETTAKDGTADTLLNISSTKVSTIGALGARAFLKPLTEQRQSYTRLCFRNRSFGLDAANVARPVLESIKEHITELDISGFVASRPEDEALGVMSIFSNALKGSRLRYLNLSDTALSEKGVMAFKELLSSQKDLEELHLMNNGLSGKAARILSKFPSTEKLKVLQMVNNCIGDDGAASIAEMVKRSPNLVSFRCSAAKIGSDGAVALAKALETCIHLDKLDLSDNLYGYEAAATLSESVTKHPVLTVIQIKATSKFARKLQNLKSAENKILDSAKRTLDGIVKNALEGSNKDLRAADLNTNMSLRVGAHCFSQSNTAKPGSMHLNCQASHEGIIGVEDGKNLPTGQE